jgi:galactan endo-1,6-beta-galactosidase
MDIVGWGLIDSNIQEMQIFGASLKYFVLSHYTRHIRPGMFILTSHQFSSNFSCAYDNSTNSLVLIFVNQSPNEIEFFFETSSFYFEPFTNHKRWTTIFDTSRKIYYQPYNDIKINNTNSFTFILPSKSITTFSISARKKE